MSTVEIESHELLAEESDRTISGLLVPYGEPCKSNLGRFTVDAGVMSIPEDVPGTVSLNDGHQRNKPIGRGVLLAERADGIHGVFAIAKGPDGDAALADVKAGRRKFLSVEADMAVEGGKAIAGKLWGAALVTAGKRGAFPSAMLLATEADDAAVDDPEDPTTAHYTTMSKDPVSGDTYETETTVEEETEEDPETGATIQTRTTTDVTTITPGTPAEGSAPVAAQPTETEPLLAERPTARVPATLRGRRAARDEAPATLNYRQFLAMMTAAAPSHAHGSWNLDKVAALRSDKRVVGTLYAELEDITLDAAGSPNDMIVPQWIGELWSGKSYQRRWIPLFGSAPLTSPTVKGWRWVTKPTVGKWDANKTDVPSGPITTEPYDVEAQPFAMAHDVDRRYTDFKVTEFWDGYWRAGTESYARESDGYVIDELLKPANAATTAVAGGVVPANVSAVLAKIVDGALAIIDEDLPSFAAVSLADYRTLALTREDDKLAFLNTALGLEEGTVETFRVIPTSLAALNTGKVLVGAKSAATVHELPGSPVRIEGLDIARGGIDPGLYGYTAVAVHNPKALALVTPHA